MHQHHLPPLAEEEVPNTITIDQGVEEINAQEVVSEDGQSQEVNDDMKQEGVLDEAETIDETHAPYDNEEIQKNQTGEEITLEDETR